MSFDHKVWNDFLDTYLTEHDDGVNRIRYGAVTEEDHDALKAYVASLSEQKVSAMDREAAMSLWLNLYNALTVDVILDHYPVKSIREISSGFLSFGPWKKNRVTVEGEELGLDDIEHVKLRPVYQDPRIHYGVNCASYGCPNLLAEAFTPENLDAQLDKGAADYVNHPRGVWSDARGRVHVSSIYHWFKEDFGNSDEGVLEHLKIYAQGETAELLKEATSIRGHDYDWALNDTEKAQ